MAKNTYLNTEITYPYFFNRGGMFGNTTKITPIILTNEPSLKGKVSTLSFHENVGMSFVKVRKIDGYELVYLGFFHLGKNLIFYFDGAICNRNKNFTSKLKSALIEEIKNTALPRAGWGFFDLRIYFSENEVIQLQRGGRHSICPQVGFEDPVIIPPTFEYIN
ncbi:MAG TPA: hypothetical protein VNI84_04425 [Pyrinomonadaceae bacterium]|nr:hypothetical protein [Pyrinomonadaceae bacterium]